jgi:ethanolamine-phosphate cytidylyltransferase
MIKRTEGVSTTDLVGRMLMCKTRPGNQPSQPTHMHRTFSRRNGQSRDDLSLDGAAAAAVAALNTSVSHFCPTSRRIRQFSSGRTPPPGARVVYVPGAFDMFHAGHVEALRAARAYGDFVLCGVHTDEAVAARRGPAYPILSLHERSLSVLACKYVDEVIIGAPATVTADILTTFNIAVVVHGSCSHEAAAGPGVSPRLGTLLGSHPRIVDLDTDAPDGQLVAGAGFADEEDDLYALPKSMGLFVMMPSPRPLTTGGIIGRILGNRARYEERNAKKGKSEAEYLAKSKTYVTET